MTFEAEPQPEADGALLELLALLSSSGYHFVTPTPATHALVRDRSPATDRDLLRDVFGWCRPFRAEQLPPDLQSLMQVAGILVETANGCRSGVRVSCVDDILYLHSAPTSDETAVFLGPDTYRFARMLKSVLGSGPPFRRALDIGTGAGVGAMTLKAMEPDAEIHASDVNPRALRLARINAAAAGLEISFQQASGLPATPRTFDLIVSNPPYIADADSRTYRDGGGDYGAGLALDWIRASVGRLTSGGRFVLYTGAPVLAGRDLVRDALTVLSAEQSLDLTYEELDPDVFGATLRQPAYRDVERIAAVCAVINEP